MRWKKAAETWGVYGLALLCAAVILFSAWWTRGQDAAERQALSDGSQRLQDATASPAPLRLVRPCAGELVRGFDAAPVFFAQSGLWQIHPRLDFAAPGHIGLPGQQHQIKLLLRRQLDRIGPERRRQQKSANNSTKDSDFFHLLSPVCFEVASALRSTYMPSALPASKKC